MSDSLDGLISRIKTAASPLRSVLSELHAKYRTVPDGKVADHIPELALADPDWFGICLVTADGQVFEVGDHARPFSIQGAARPFVYGLALEDHGLAAVLARVGLEPTRERPGAAVLDEASNRPFNPLVSAGAIAVADMVQGRDLSDRSGRLLTTFRRYCGREVQIDS
jgi:glutaminase